MSERQLKLKLSCLQTKSFEEMVHLLGSPAEVIKKALCLLNVAINELKNDNQIAVVNNGEILKKIIGIKK